MRAIILTTAELKVTDIRRGLRAENFFVKKRIFNPDAEDVLDVFEMDILVLAVRSPKRELLHRIPHFRQKKYLLPIVVIDEDKDEETEKLAREKGADYYFGKPILYPYFALRLKNLICKKEAQGEDRFMRAWNIWLDIKNRVAKRDRLRIPLRNKEYSLLEFFILNRGKVLTRNNILEHVWDRNANFASNTVDVHINRLRRKLDDPFQEKMIHTVPCVGYVFEKRKRLK